MKRFLASQNCISIFFIFSLICGVLTYHWTTAHVSLVNIFMWATAQASYLLIAIFIGIHLHHLRPIQNGRTILLSITIGYLLLQLISYPLQHINVLPLHWSSFVNPQAFSKLLVAALISLSVVLIHYNLKSKQPWREFLIPTGLLLVTLILVSTYKFYSVFVYALTILGSFFVSKNSIPQGLSLFVRNTPKLWFYGSLIFASLVTLWFPPFFENIRIAYQYLTCFSISILILLVAKTPPFLLFNEWIYEWLRWVSYISFTNIKDSSLEIYHLLTTAPSPILKKLSFASLYFLRITTITTIAFLIIELPIRSWSINEVFTWASTSGFFIAVTYGFIFASYCSLRAFLNLQAAVVMLFFIAIIISATSAIKASYLGLPLVPSDFNFLNQAFDSLGFLIGKAGAFFTFSFFFLIIFFFGLACWRFPKQLLNQNIWMGLRGIFAFIFALWLIQPGTLKSIEQSTNAWENGNSLGLYKTIGFVPGFWIRYQQFFIPKPQDFSKTSIQDLSAKLHITIDINTSEQHSYLRAFNKPHIIAIQSEAFWDPGLLREDLYPNGSPADLSVLCLHTDGYCQTGYVEVPVFGGATANSEFEFLTGLSLSLFPSGAAPFVHYVQNPIASIGWRLQQANYQTLGIHPNAGWFWNRDTVYPLLGFQEFMDLDSFSEEEKELFYVGDHAITQKIKKRIEQAHQPQFIFAVTMANHAPFVDQRYSALPDEPINWERLPALTPEEQQAIKTYSIGVRESRAALKELLDTYSEKDAPPVIIVFYGDHLPILGENYSIYHKSGFKLEDMIEPFRELYSTPYLVWSNKAISHSLNENMPVSLLGQELMDIAGFGKSGLQQVISQLQNTYFLSKPPRAQILRGELPTPLNKQQQMAVELYKHANFDALFHQHTPAFFGLVSPTTKKPVANLDVDQ